MQNSIKKMKNSKYQILNQNTVINICKVTRESFHRCPENTESLIPVSFGQGIPISHSKIEDAQTCALTDARNKAAIGQEIHKDIRNSES